MSEREPEPSRAFEVNDRAAAAAAADEQARRSRLESLITSISTELTIVGHERLDAALGQALQRIGEAIEADRAWICRLSADSRLARLTHEWCTRGGSAFESIDGIPLADRPWLWQRLRSRETVAVRDLADLPAEAAATRRFLIDLGARTLLALPLSAGSRVLGYAAFTSAGREIARTPDDLALLQFVGDVLADALERLDDEVPADPAPDAGRAEPTRWTDLLRAQRDILERIAEGADLEPVPAAICATTERFVPGMAVSLWSIEGPDGLLRPVATAGVPPELIAALDGLEPGLDAGPFGQTCAGDRVVVDDLMREASVQSYREPALRHGVRACWTEPVRDAEARVVGLLALFGREPRLPAPGELEVVEDAARMAGLALARLRDRRPAPGGAGDERLQLLLRQARKMEALGQLTGGVAHDFNNILTVILGTAEMALESIDRGVLRSGEDARVPLQQVRKAAERAAALTRQLLAYSRDQARDQEVLDPNRMIADLEPMLRRLIGEHITLETSFGEELGQVRVDAGQLEQVLLNLVLNARDAMPGGGRLSIETGAVNLGADYVARHRDARPGPHVMIRVRDTGCGMNHEMLERIFDPFFTTKPRGQGTGLGLATVRGIVSRAGGHIVVASEPGCGTTFGACLPVVRRSGSGSRASEADAPVRAETVLVCEDDEMLRDLARQVLEAAGYTVLLAANGAHALHVAEAHAGPIHLLLTDAVMPEAGGAELTSLLGRQRPGLRVLYMSGYGPQLLERQGLAGDAELLEKPFSAAMLLARVRALLDREPQAEAGG